MKSLVLENPGSLAWQDVPPPVPGPGEALVRVRRCGRQNHFGIAGEFDRTYTI